MEVDWARFAIVETLLKILFFKSGEERIFMFFFDFRYHGQIATTILIGFILRGYALLVLRFIPSRKSGNLHG